MDPSAATSDGGTETEMPFQSVSYAYRSVSRMPSETALALKASRSALSFVLLVPLTAGGLASSTNQLVAVSFAAPPRGPEAPSPAPAGATARPATHTSVITSSRLLISILPLPEILVRPRRLGLSESWRYRTECQERSTPFGGELSATASDRSAAHDEGERRLARRDPRAVAYALGIRFREQPPSLVGVEIARLDGGQALSTFAASCEHVGGVPIHDQIPRRRVPHRHVNQHLAGLPAAPHVVRPDEALQPPVAARAGAAKDAEHLPRDRRFARHVVGERPRAFHGLGVAERRQDDRRNGYTDQQLLRAGHPLSSCSVYGRLEVVCVPRRPEGEAQALRFPSWSRQIRAARARCELPSYRRHTDRRRQSRFRLRHRVATPGSRRCRRGSRASAAAPCTTPTQSRSRTPD